MAAQEFGACQTCSIRHQRVKTCSSNILVVRSMCVSYYSAKENWMDCKGTADGISEGSQITRKKVETYLRIGVGFNHIFVFNCFFFRQGTCLNVIVTVSATKTRGKKGCNTIFSQYRYERGEGHCLSTFLIACQPSILAYVTMESVFLSSFFLLCHSLKWIKASHQLSGERLFYFMKEPNVNRVLHLKWLAKKKRKMRQDNGARTTLFGCVHFCINFHHRFFVVVVVPRQIVECCFRMPI